jgi:hypothetical protein
MHADGRSSDAETLPEQTFDVNARDQVWIIRTIGAAEDPIGQ